MRHTAFSVGSPPFDDSPLGSGKFGLSVVFVGLRSPKLLDGLFFVGLDSDSSCELPDS